MALERRENDVNMIRHDGPGVEQVTRGVKVEHRVLDNSRCLGIGEQRRAPVVSWFAAAGDGLGVTGLCRSLLLSSPTGAVKTERHEVCASWTF